MANLVIIDCVMLGVPVIGVLVGVLGNEDGRYRVSTRRMPH